MLGEVLLNEKTPLNQQSFRKSERQKKQNKKHSEAKIHVFSFGYLGNPVISFFYYVSSYLLLVLHIINRTLGGFKIH